MSMVRCPRCCRSFDSDRAVEKLWSADDQFAGWCVECVEIWNARLLVGDVVVPLAPEDYRVANDLLPCTRDCTAEFHLDDCAAHFRDPVARALKYAAEQAQNQLLGAPDLLKRVKKQKIDFEEEAKKILRDINGASPLDRLNYVTNALYRAHVSSDEE